ncbi:MAG: glycosyltransferase family 4 protein [Coriobacteriia bacterium]|nr:glycosyltransferase family 4 protein [Coriobacteriia bacterium]
MLAGKRICLSHPYNIAYDVRLLKSVRALQEAGAEVSIMVRKWETTGETPYHDLCEIIEVDTTAYLVPVTHSEHRIGPLKVLWNLAVYEPMRHWCTTKKKVNLLTGFAEEMIARDFDIVHFTDYVSAAEALRMTERSDIPVVYETYEYSPTIIAAVPAHQDVARFYADQEIAAMDSADAVIVVSEDIKERYGRETTNDNVHVVLNVPPNTPLPPRSVRDPMRFYFQSIIRPDYGLEMLIDAFSQVKGGWELAIQGPNAYPEYRKELERRVEERGLQDRVSFPDPVTSLEVVEAANAHDVGLWLIPTVQKGQVRESWKLTLANKLFVYANAGLAMVMGDYTATKHVMSGYDAVSWVDELSREDIVAHIQELVDNPVRVDAMKRASAAWSQHYNLAIGLQQVRDAYLSVVSR